MRSSINVSIDDVSPHPLASIDCVKTCEWLIKRHPSIKFSLFVPMAYWRTCPPTESMTKSPLWITEHVDFCDALLDLPKKNFELCFHGLFHGVPGKSNNDEFNDLSYDDAVVVLNKMIAVAKRAGVCERFSRVFRPPAWRMSPGSIRAARDLGFKALALSNDEYALKAYCGEERARDDVVFYTAAPPIKALSVCEKTEIVYHALEHDKNFLNDSAAVELDSFLSKLSNDVEFKFIEELL